MITKEMTTRQIAQLLMPVFKDFDVNDVWLIDEFATRKFEHDELMCKVIFDDEGSRIQDNIDAMFELWGSLALVAENVISIAMSDVRSTKMKKQLITGIKLEVN